MIDFYFHVRDVHRKPGGWRLPIVSRVMGLSISSPLLFDVSAYLGFIASFLRRGKDEPDRVLPRPAHAKDWAKRIRGEHEPISWTQDMREGRLHKQRAIATVVSAFFSGFEAWYS